MIHKAIIVVLSVLALATLGLWICLPQMASGPSPLVWPVGNWTAVAVLGSHDAISIAISRWTSALPEPFVLNQGTAQSLITFQVEMRYDGGPWIYSDQLEGGGSYKATVPIPHQLSGYSPLIIRVTKYPDAVTDQIPYGSSLRFE